MIPVTSNLLGVLRARGHSIGFTTPMPPGIMRELADAMETNDVEGWYLNDYTGWKMRISFFVSPGREGHPDFFLAGWTSAIDKHGYEKEDCIRQRINESDLGAVLKEVALFTDAAYRKDCLYTNSFTWALLCLVPTILGSVFLALRLSQTSWVQRIGNEVVQLLLTVFVPAVGTVALLLLVARELGKLTTRLLWRKDPVAQFITGLQNPT